MANEQESPLLQLTAQIVSNYVVKNPIPAAGLPGLIASVSQSMQKLSASAAPVLEPTKAPAVDPKKSVHPDHIVCLEDGKRFRSLKRHLGAEHGLTPEQYRQKWSLPADYPMVASSYAATRSDLAKKMGLGRKSSSDL